MSSANHEVIVREMIESLYRVAGLPVWKGEINDSVATIVQKTLYETRKCSAAFVWVPQPPGGRASVFWLVTNIGRSAFNASVGKLSRHCARTAILKWRTALEIATHGLASSRRKVVA